MLIALHVALVLLFFSIVLNGVLIFKIKKPQINNQALNILADLLNKQKVLIKLERVDPSTFFLRSPKE